MRSTIVRKGAVAVAVLSLGTLLASCGGSGGGGTSVSGTSTGGTSGTSTGGTYLAYFGNSPSNADLYFVDPSNPTSSITVTTIPTAMCEPLEVLGGYNISNRSYTNFYIKDVDCVQLSNTLNFGQFSTLGGPLIKVSLIKSNTIPSPIQISSLTNVFKIANYWDDEINGIQYLEVYTSYTQGYLVNSRMTPTDNPIPLNGMQIKYPIYDLTGSITGFVVQNGNTLEECNPSLSNCSLLASSVTSVIKMATDPSNENMFLCVNGNVDKLSGSSLTSMSLSCGSMSSFTNDNQNIYAVDNNGNVLELSFSNPSATWQTMYVNSGGLKYVGINNMTQNYLIIIGYDTVNNTGNLVAISKSGSPSVTFYSFNTETTRTGSEFSLSNQLLFTVAYNSSQSSGSESSISALACVWTQGSSSASCTPNSYWAGESVANSGTFNFYSGFTPYKILEVENTTASFLGGALYAVDPTNLSSQTFLGNIPSNYTTFYGLGIGNAMLLNAFNTQQNYSPGVLDAATNVFFTNFSSNTLIKISNISGYPVYPLYVYPF